MMLFVVLLLGVEGVRPWEALTCLAGLAALRMIGRFAGFTGWYLAHVDFSTACRREDETDRRGLSSCWQVVVPGLGPIECLGVVAWCCSQSRDPTVHESMLWRTRA